MFYHGVPVKSITSLILHDERYVRLLRVANRNNKSRKKRAIIQFIKGQTNFTSQFSSLYFFSDTEKTIFDLYKNISSLIDFVK
jgi:cytidylate kinase